MKKVTVNDARHDTGIQISLPRVGDMLWLKNDEVIFPQGGGLWCPDWIQVEIVSISDRWCAVSFGNYYGNLGRCESHRWDGVHENWEAFLAHCSQCQAWYLRRRWVYETKLGKCKACTDSQRSKRQRERRTVERAEHLARNCIYCGQSISSNRRTKKFCSTRCKVAMHRKTVARKGE